MSCNNIESAPAGSALSRPVVKRTRKMRIQLHFLSAFAASILGPLTASAQGPTVYRVSTFAGSVSTPTSDTDALSLTLNTAFGLARDSQGNFYIADYGNHRIRKVTAAGRASVIAGTGAQGFTGNNGPATSAQLTYPRSIALDGDKYLYISEPIINRIRRIDLSTGIITLVVGDGVSRYNGDGAVGTSTSISEVLGMAVDGQGSLFIADSGSHRIRKLSSKDGTMSTIAGTGAVGRTDAGIATDAPISRPTGMAIGINGDLYFSDIGNGIIQRIRAGVISTVAGSTASTARTGLATLVRIATCMGMVVNAAATGLYFTDEDSDTVRLLDFSSQQVSIVAGNGSAAFSGDGGPATQAALNNPEHVVLEPGGVVVADASNNRIRRIVPGGAITTIAGGSVVTNGDGGIATQATLKAPVSARLDPKGNLIIGEQNGCVARIVDTIGRISTLAGPIPSCLLGAAAADSQGNVYIASSLGLYVRSAGDPVQGRLRMPGQFVDVLVSRDEQRVYLLESPPAAAKVWFTTPASITGQGTPTLTAFAGGNPGSEGDGGPALGNVLFIPKALGEDASGNIYILDVGNRNIRRVDRQTGIISTVVSSDPFFLGRSLAVDASNHYLVTVGNQIARFTSQGVGDSVVGSGLTGLSADGLDGYLASMNNPMGITLAADGTAYFADDSNNLVRRLTPVTAVKMDAVAGKPLASGAIPAQVLVTASDRAVLGGLTVKFSVTSGTASLSASSAITDVRGIASVSVGLASASATVTAVVTGLPPVDINVTATGSSAAVLRPGISNVISLSGFGGAKSITAGGWVEIYGANWATAERLWTANDFQNNTAPTTLSGVRVLMNGIPAFMEFVSATQINCQVPDGVGTGNVSVTVVTAANGTSDPFIVSAAARVPGLLAPASFNVGGKQYVAAILPDQTFVGPIGLVAGAAFRPAAPGDRVLLFAVGFGTTSPPTPAGQIASQLTALPNVDVRFGNVPAVVEYAGAAGSYVGLYQFNVVVPSGVSGDVPLTVNVDGVPLSQQLWITLN